MKTTGTIVLLLFLVQIEHHKLCSANLVRLRPKRNYWTVRLLPLVRFKNHSRSYMSHTGRIFLCSHCCHSSAESNTLGSRSTYQNFFAQGGQNWLLHSFFFENFSSLLYSNWTIPYWIYIKFMYVSRGLLDRRKWKILLRH